MHHILLVDDSAIARTVIKRSLDICGFHEANKLEAENGRKALDILKKQRVDLVITDLNMPVMDGEGLIKRMKSSPRFFDIPVIVITSLNNPANEQKLLRENANAVLSKPLSLPAMHKALSDCFKLI